MSSLSEASVRTLGDVGKMGGLAVALGLTDVVFEAENQEKSRKTFILTNF